MVTAVRNEVITLRLYCKTPGTERLRKGAAGERRQYLATGWRETKRTVAVNHLNLRMERPVARTIQIGRAESDAAPRRPPRRD